MEQRNVLSSTKGVHITVPAICWLHLLLLPRHHFTSSHLHIINWINVCVFGVLSEERAPSSVIVPEPGERGPSSAFSPDPESSPLPHAGVETDWRWGVGVVEGLWKTRDNGGKAAWLFIGVFSRVYWISDVITDDELAVLIICACSSQNFLIKHHLFNSFT